MRKLTTVVVVGSVSFLGLLPTILHASGLDRKAQTTTYTVRYVCFFARPKTATVPLKQPLILGKSSSLTLQTNQVIENQPPPAILESMTGGVAVPIGDSSPAFLNRLAAQQSDYTFHSLLEAKSVARSGRSIRLEKYPQRNATNKVSLINEIMITPLSDAKVMVRQNGFLAYVNQDGSIERTEWNNAQLKAKLGATYNMGVVSFPNGDQLTLAFTVVANSTTQSPTNVQ